MFLTPSIRLLPNNLKEIQFMSNNFIHEIIITQYILPNFVTLITSHFETRKFENSASLLSICQPQVREGVRLGYALFCFLVVLSNIFFCLCKLCSFSCERWTSFISVLANKVANQESHGSSSNQTAAHSARWFLHIDRS